MRTTIAMVCACVVLGCAAERNALVMEAGSGNQDAASMMDASQHARNEPDASDSGTDAAADATITADAAHDAAPVLDSGGTDASGAGGSGGNAGTGNTGGTSGSGGASGTGSACECNTVSECCDGCALTNVCDALRAEPQCQAATCHDVYGCAFVSVREALPCDDGNPRTYADACRSGVCRGTACECDLVGGCCDGCRILPMGTECNPHAFAQCLGDNHNVYVVDYYVLHCNGIDSRCTGVATKVNTATTVCAYDERCRGPAPCH